MLRVAAPDSGICHSSMSVSSLLVTLFKDWLPLWLIDYFFPGAAIENRETAMEGKNKAAKTSIERRKISQNWQTYLQSSNDVISNKKPIQRDHTDINKHLKQFTMKRKKETNNNPSLNVMRNDRYHVTKPKQTQSGANNGAVITHYVAMDCEMVGIGSDALESMLARVSIVNKFGDCIYDSFVLPRETVTDYRTPVSGVRKEDLETGKSFEVVQKEVADILKGKTLIGHALKHDLEVLFLSHPNFKMRDTSRYQPFKMVTGGNTPSLRVLTKKLLGVDIQSGEHSSVEDARAAMQLYCLHSRQWEDMISSKRKRMRVNAQKQSINHQVQ